MTKNEILRFQPPVAELLGREVIDVDTENGAATLHFLARPDFANRHGTVQGGLIAAMLDSATALALYAVLPVEQTAVTTNLNVSFLKPACIGPFVAVSKLLSRDHRYGETSAELRDPDGVVVATAVAKLRIVRRRMTTDE
ncbi:MAG TPA: PaaI family thioesterase [Povalibacter sp.]|uniref:PaaI family thioesterase n=1 Tax=Povalibacter sp. TaxID=1962978 RepID=UPI002C2D0C35|nr:PaaI family thioesterase [Povalibacter sp.]HMN44028.1 PaaI family thioesterase [Povalibacter sp.]